MSEIKKENRRCNGTIIIAQAHEPYLACIHPSEEISIISVLQSWKGNINSHTMFRCERFFRNHITIETGNEEFLKRMTNQWL